MSKISPFVVGVAWFTVCVMGLWWGFMAFVAIFGPHVDVLIVCVVLVGLYVFQACALASASPAIKLWAAVTTILFGILLVADAIRVTCRQGTFDPSYMILHIAGVVGALIVATALLTQRRGEAARDPAP